MKNLLPDYIIENYKNNKTSGSFDAFTMFIDISGFTPMTEKLMKGGKEGAEILSNILKDVFKSTVKYVYQSKGFISNFAGDAFTAIFQINDSNSLQESALELLNCSNKILKEVQKNALHETKFGNFDLKVQIGVSFGKINWAIIGDTYKSYYIRGEAIKGCVESENNAKANEIVIDERFKKILDKNITLKDNVKKGYYVVKNFKGINTFKQETINKPSILSITKELFSKKFLPAIVFNVKNLGEFRYVVSVFISFRGLYKSEETDNFFNIILNRINDCSGYLKEIDFGDKGGVIVCYIGAPISFEDNIERALNFILSIQYEILNIKNFSESNFKAGITYGKVYAGIIGGEERCQYAMVGDMVNLASRFMEKANWGEILTDEAIFQKAKENFQIESIGRHQFKGLSEEVNTYRLSNKKATETRNFYSGIMVGRESEIKQMHIFVNKVFKDKNAGVLFVNGEAGLGKSRLVNEFRKDLEKKYKVNWFYCPAQKTLNHSLDPFKYFFKNYFNQFTNDSIEKNKINFNKKIEQLVNNLQIIINPDIETIINELKRTRSIIGALLDLHWENSLYEQLGPQLKFENTLLAIFNFILAECIFKPVIIEL